MGRNGEAYRTWRHQADAVLAQAAPVQNTWYTVLATTADVRLIGIEMSIAVAVETLELRIVVDGVTLTATQAAAVVGTPYYVAFDTDTADALISSTTSYGPYGEYLLEGHSVAVSVRKTTALGAGNLVCLVKYARLRP